MESEQNHSTIRDTAKGGDEIDFSLLEDSLRLTPWERFLENERALALVRMLEAAKADNDRSPRPNS